MYPVARKLNLPLAGYKVSGYSFKQNVSSNNACKGVHLGEDARCKAGAKIKAIGAGEVVYCGIHPGAPRKGNWGGIIIIGHRQCKTKNDFYSLYGHLGKKYCNTGDKVKIGQTIALIGQSYTPNNGFWPTHLHFAIYLGPWKGAVLPGYYREGTLRTKLEYWRSPSNFIRNYNQIK
ncbi:MAG: M23 family metallopeptidase [Candidatus Moranbacteria bacterium]|nr:M23 family metallopeptidase [Candidatus Moranbacteria bacterium]